MCTYGFPFNLSFPAVWCVCVTSSLACLGTFQAPLDDRISGSLENMLLPLPPCDVTRRSPLAVAPKRHFRLFPASLLRNCLRTQEHLEILCILPTRAGMLHRPFSYLL